jgi:MoaA/NifB/PqqE/SkfB family radical SAM enzyme
MNLSELERLYQSAKKEGFVFNNIWGGEPLIREDIVDVVQASKRNQLLTTLVTNGQFLEEMHEVGRWTDVLVVSLDAPDSDHDRIRGIEGLYSKAIRGMERIRRQYPKVHLNICCVLSTLNRNRTEEMIWLAREVGGSIYFCPVGDNKSIDEWPDQEGVGKFKKSWEEISEDFRIIRDYKKKGFPIESSFFLIDHFQGGGGPYLCKRPRIYLNVYANGDVETCYLGTFANCRTMELSNILKLPAYREAVFRSEECRYGCNANDAIEISGLWRFRPSSLRNWI